MKKNMILIIAALIIVVLAFAFFKDKIVAKALPASDMDTFAKCLTAKGATFYGASWCGHCANQKKMFGDSFKNVNYIECATPDGQGQTDACKFAGITGYPTWDISGERMSGEIPLETLSEKTGCQLT